MLFLIIVPLRSSLSRKCVLENNVCLSPLFFMENSVLTCSSFLTLKLLFIYRDFLVCRQKCIKVVHYKKLLTF
ncbi:hypothetical protein Bca101_062463 [Brassica carinata]